MNIVQITPGAGGMYCGNCFRDNQLVAELRRLGHGVLMIPLYLPMTLDEADQSSGIPIFFGGINVYLEQKLPLLRHMPGWLHKQLSSPGILKWASGRAAKTRAQDLGDLTVSMLRGEEGRQVREIQELVHYLKTHQKPDVICLSNALLVGMGRKLKKELGVPVVCMLQGEDSFLDSLNEEWRGRAWETLRERSREFDLFIGPSRYYAERMRERLGLPAEKVRVVYNGIRLQGYSPAHTPPERPVLGFFARLCKAKGLDLLVEAFISLKQRRTLPGLRLHLGGSMGPSDEPLVEEMKARLQGAGILGDVGFYPNLSKEQKQQFYRGLSVLSVPALYGEAFGLYLAEAWASGVPVVQPPVAAFPELIAESGAGLLAADATPESLAAKIEELLLDEAKRSALASGARKAAEQKFSAGNMALKMVEAISPLTRPLASVQG